MSQKEKLALGAVVAAAMGGVIYNHLWGVGISALNIIIVIRMVILRILEIIILILIIISISIIIS